MSDHFGRPKEYDRMKIGQDLVKWAKTNPEALTIPMFATSIGLHSGILRNWCTEDEHFRALFMQAKEQVGINRLKSTQETSKFKLDNSIYRGTLHHYDLDIKEDIREEKAFEANINKPAPADNKEVVQKLDAVMDMLDEAQGAKSSLKRAESKNKAEDNS